MIKKRKQETPLFGIQTHDIAVTSHASSGTLDHLAMQQCINLPLSAANVQVLFQNISSYSVCRLDSRPSSDDLDLYQDQFKFQVCNADYMVLGTRLATRVLVVAPMTSMMTQQRTRTTCNPKLIAIFARLEKKLKGPIRLFHWIRETVQTEVIIVRPNFAREHF